MTVEAKPGGRRLERAAVVVLGVYLTGTGASAIARGTWFYTDYLGLLVPAPLSIVAGLLLLLLGTARWRSVDRERPHRPR